MRRVLWAVALVLGGCGGNTPPPADVHADLGDATTRSNAARLAANPALAAPFVEEYDVPRLRVDVEDAPRRGAEHPLVTIVTFSDFQCPFCSRVQPTLARLLETYPDDVQLVFRNNPLPFHDAAMPAAEAALEAYRQGGAPMFWRFHDLLFENQRNLTRADLEAYAIQLGMDVAALSRALDRGTHQPVIRADQAATVRLDARGTPAFFINGRVLMGAQPYESFEEVVEEELALARSDVARGTPRDAVYARRMEHALAEAPEREPEPEPEPEERPEPDPAAVYRVPITGGSIGDRPVSGRADALVTVVMFGDYQCPFCSRAESTLDEVRRNYGADVRIVYMQHPLGFHERAMPSAEAAEEVLARRGAAAFYRFSALLYENQSDLSDETLVRLAQQVGVSRRQIETALSQHPHRARIEAMAALAVSLGASGTPAFFVNGRNIRGAQPYPAFEAVIDEELARARALVAAGTPRRAVYERAIRDGHTSQQLVVRTPTPSPAAPDPDRVYAFAVPPDAPTRGPASAPVTIQIFSDFQCPFCSRAVPTLNQIVSRYGDRVRLVWRDYPLPFHRRAMPAAEVGREVLRQAGSEAFWRYHNLAFEHQRELEDDDLVRYAVSAGARDERALRRALRDHTHRAGVDADMRAISDAGARIGTPSFFINGRLLQGAQPFSEFERRIDEALQTAAP